MLTPSLQALSNLHSLTASLFGVSAGILGLESYYGFLIYFVFSFITTLLFYFLKRIAEKLPEKLKALGLDKVPMTVFPKGAWYALDSACNLGYNVVGMDWLHDPKEAVKIRGDRNIVFQGNADPGVLYGTKEGITTAVQEMVDGFWVGNKGWIANLGHGMFSVRP